MGEPVLNTLVTEKIRRGWESRLPEINPPWTHWRLQCEGETLADVPADDLLGALRVLESNYGRGRIFALRVIIGEGGQCERIDKATFQISKKSYD